MSMSNSSILLVEPRKSKNYHTQYPPLGLLKIASYHKNIGDDVRFIRGLNDEDSRHIQKIYITSLFTYAWKPVHEVIDYYCNKYKMAEIVVGGVYASLCKEHLRNTYKDRIEIHKGLYEEAEEVLPDYSLVPEWDASILFTSRGCIRSCPFCAVKELEPKYEPKKSVKHLIYPSHRKVVLWDNNILASPHWESIFQELEESNKEIDFNQGIDARLIDEKVVFRLKRLKIKLLRLAYDTLSMREPLKKAIELLKANGFNGGSILVYCLYNNPYEYDNPETFLSRLQDLIEWGVASYPMRFEPLEPGEKNTFVSPNWYKEHLEMVAKARRVLGYGGAFPPYEGLKKKFLNAKNFEEALCLREINK